MGSQSSSDWIVVSGTDAIAAVKSPHVASNREASLSVLRSKRACSDVTIREISAKPDMFLVAADLHLVRHLALHAAVPAAVAEVNRHSDDEPDDQAPPRVTGKAGHDAEGNHDAENGNQRDQRRLEWPMQFRTPHAQNPNARAHNDEGQ